MLKLYHAPTRQQCGVDLEVRVLGRGANHNDGTVLNRMQKRILLRLRKTVNLVDEQDGTAVIRIQARLCLVDHATQVLHGTRDGADLDKLTHGMVGDNMRQRRLARTSRAVQNHARQHVMLNRGAQPRALTDGLLLAHILVERIGAHTHRKRGILKRALARRSRKKVVHSHPVHQSKSLLTNSIPKGYELPFVNIGAVRKL